MRRPPFPIGRARASRAVLLASSLAAGLVGACASPGSGRPGGFFLDGGTTDLATPRDLRLADLSPLPGSDLAAADLEAPLDEARPADLDVPRDQAMAPPDLTVLVDLTVPPDLRLPPDMTIPPDLLKPGPACNDNIKNGAETDVDCGGGICAACATGKGCAAVADCASRVCVMGRCSQGLAFSESNPATGQRPWSLAIDDWDGDGRWDVAVTNNMGNSVSVLLGNGNGTFKPAASYATAAGPSVVTYGDFDADGIFDLVTANSGSNTISWLRGNANGSFRAPVNTNVGADPEFVNTADFNADNRLDLIVSQYQANSVRRLSGNGNGTFAMVADVVVNGPFGTAINDYNLDGRWDFAVAASGGNNMAVLTNPNFNGLTYGTGMGPTVVVTGDINGDGRDDIVTSNFAADTVSVFLAALGGGFANHVTYPTGASPQFMTGTDYNGDGTIDLVVTNVNADTISILPGLPNGSFLPGVTIPVGHFPRDVTTADLNGDKKPDIVVANSGSNTLSVLLNTSK